jgi:hypothetical protein
MKTGGKTARALLELYFHPDDGLLAWLLHLRRLLDWPVKWNVKQMAEFFMEPNNTVSTTRGSGWVDDEHAISH